MTATAEGRKLRALGDVAVASTTKGDPLAEPNAPYIGLEHIERDLGIISGHGRAADVRSTKSIFKTGDLLYGKLRPYLNKVWVAQFDGMCSTDILVYPKTDVVENAFLKYRFMASDFVSYANENSNGVNLPRVNAKVLARFPVWLPLPPEQRRIVAEIEKQFTRLEAGVAALQRVQANLKRYRSTVLRAACEGRLVPTEASLAKAEDRKFETGDETLARVLSERRQCWHGRGQYKEPTAADSVSHQEIPEGWASCSIGQVSECLDGQRVPVNKAERAKRLGDVPYYGANGQVGWIDEHLFEEPLVLVVEDETFTGRTQAFSYVIRGKTWVNNHAHVLRATPAVSTAFLNCSLAHYPFTERTTGSTGRRKLTQKALMAAPYLLPPLAEQTRIVAEVERRLSVTDELEAAVSTNLQRVVRLRQSILRQAFEGRLIHK